MTVNDPFYESFQHYFRGSKAEITSRLEIYQRYLEPILLEGELTLVDLGCGRGEWLELTKAWGFKPTGFDTDEGMLQHCREMNLDVQNCDALSALKNYPDGSVAVISSFHLVEHLEFNDLRDLLNECVRVLAKDGILILETPNPEHPRVMGETFWLDPTHTRPLPPGFLSFLASYHGLHLHKIIRLNEKHSVNLHPNLNDVFNMTSPDFALIAVKSKNEKIRKKIEDLFKLQVGTNFDHQIKQFDDRLAQRLNNIDKNISDIENRVLRLILNALKRVIKSRLNYLFKKYPIILLNKIIVRIYSLIRKNSYILGALKKIISFNPKLEKYLIQFVRMNTQSSIQKLSLSQSATDKHLFFNQYVYKNEIETYQAELYLSRLNKDQ